MNTIINDYGKTVTAVGADGSIERVRVQYPKLINALNVIYNNAVAYHAYGMGIDDAVKRIRQYGIDDALTTRNLLLASHYAREAERAGSVTAMVIAL